MFDSEGNYILCQTTGKRCLTKREADEILANVRRKHHGSRHSKIPKRNYLCEYCNTYHLTAMAWCRDSRYKDCRKKNKKIRFIK